MARLNVKPIIKSYLNKKQWRVKENANITYSLSSMMLHLSNSCIARYTLDNVYTPRITKAHREGDIHIHDLGMGITGYCAGWSLQKLLIEGFNGVEGKIESSPAKHFDTALLQIANFLGTLQNEWSGAQAINSVDTLLAPFVRADGLDYRRVKQLLQTFVYNLNISSRWGGQTPFTNVSLDITVPEDLASQSAIVGGKPLGSTYSDYEKEILTINKALTEVFLEGDSAGRPFTFPIPSYGITDDFVWDGQLPELLFKLTAKFGTPYFQNFVNSDIKPSDVRSMCCRLRLDTRELEKDVSGGLFGSGDSTGSVGVVTINMPRIGYLTKTEDDFFSLLKTNMDIAKDSLERKRDIVEANIKNDLLPFTKRYLGNLRRHFSTIGLVGMNEACLNFLGKDISSIEGKDLTQRTLQFMLGNLREYQQETEHYYNLEATPAEGTSYRLAQSDKGRYSNIITKGKTVPYYTNSTNLPVDSELDLISALKHQEDIQTYYTGGSVFHVFLGESMPSWESCKALMRKITKNTRLPYLTITPTYSICANHGYIRGEVPKCSKCGARTEVYSRVVGYYRPVSNWNKGKEEEYKERRSFDV